MVRCSCDSWKAALPSDVLWEGHEGACSTQAQIAAECTTNLACLCPIAVLKQNGNTLTAVDFKAHVGESPTDSCHGFFILS